MAPWDHGQLNMDSEGLLWGSYKDLLELSILGMTEMCWEIV